MFKNSLGTKTLAEELIFPLVSFNPDSNIWKCVGTGFFIQGYGGFVTAKHVFFDNTGEPLPTMFGIQSTSSNELHVRPVENLALHIHADIGVGMLGKRRMKGKINIEPVIAPSFTLNFHRQKNGDNVRTFAFPLTETQTFENGEFEFTFIGKWSVGQIVDFHEEGSPMVRNRCYQTNMDIEHGASGGPVLNNDLVIGINSSGMEVMESESPISFVTPIDLILDLSVPYGKDSISIKELTKNGSIHIK